MSWTFSHTVGSNPVECLIASKLRNRIVLANALVWILIVFVLGMLMF
jgi:hypothetical protein